MRVKLNNTKKVFINSDFIKLDSLLKYAAIVSTGGEAKYLIKSGYVSVNNEVCIQRGKKINPGSVVKIHNEILFIKKRT